MEPGYLDAAGFAAWENQAKQYMSGIGYTWASIWQGFRASHLKGPDADAMKDAIFAQMIGIFVNHPDNPYHCPGATYDAPLNRFGSLASTAARSFTAQELDSLVPARSNKVPVLLLAGACNTWIGAPLQQRHVSLFTNARLEEIPNSGHAMFQDNASATLAAIRGFLVSQN